MIPTPQTIQEQLRALHVCVVMPTYNNAGTLLSVLARVMPYAPHVVVVNDGCTDATQTCLQQAQAQYANKLTVVQYQPNQGKGFALVQGFKKAYRLGYAYALTIDSDGQHYPEDIPNFLPYMAAHPGALLVGNRNLTAPGMPAKNSFANYFSNGWFALQTWTYLPDTQSGFRVYPLAVVAKLKAIPHRYEAELALMVFSAWKGVKPVPVPIRVYYPPANERVSHFRPGVDFMRITCLNTILCMLMLVYGWPSMLFYQLKRLVIAK